MDNNQCLALIGAGHWGKNLARNFYSLGVLHTICDTRQPILSLCAVDYPDISLETDYSAVLKNTAITQVAIASPAALHYTMAKQALLAGKDVYVEKPLCLKTEEGEELVQLAAQKKKILFVGHLLQYHPVVATLQKLVSKGELGKLHYIASHRLSLGQIRTEENNLWSFAPHDVSVILSLANNEAPLSVSCSGHACLSIRVVDMTITTLKFPHDLHAHIYTSWIHPFKEQKLVVIGSNGMVVFDDTKPWEEKLQIYRQPVKWVDGNIPQPQKSDGEKIIVVQQEPLKEECIHFIQCCKARIQPKTDGKEGLRVLRVLEAAQKSMDNNGSPIAPAEKKAPYCAHPTALIDPNAQIGTGTKIWHFSHIMDKAIIGEGCNIGQNVVLSPEVILGNNVKVQNNVSIYTGVTCEDNVFLGPSMVFTNVINPRSNVIRRGEYQSTVVRQGASIGANATIVCGTELGAYCFIGAGTVVTKDVKPYALMVGNPARQIGWMSRHGHRLELPVMIHKDEEMRTSCPATGEVYVLKGDALFLESSLFTETYIQDKP